MSLRHGKMRTVTVLLNVPERSIRSIVEACRQHVLSRGRQQGMSLHISHCSKNSTQISHLAGNMCYSAASETPQLFGYSRNWNWLHWSNDNGIRLRYWRLPVELYRKFQVQKHAGLNWKECGGGIKPKIHLDKSSVRCNVEQQLPKSFVLCLKMDKTPFL